MMTMMRTAIARHHPERGGILRRVASSSSSSSSSSDRRRVMPRGQPGRLRLRQQQQQRRVRLSTATTTTAAAKAASAGGDDTAEFVLRLGVLAGAVAGGCACASGMLPIGPGGGWGWGGESGGGGDAGAAATDAAHDHHFDVMAALEVREELEKVRLAQLIHDLHRLAQQKEQKQRQEQSGEDKDGTGTGFRVRRYVTMAFQSRIKPQNQQQQRKRNQSANLRRQLSSSRLEAGSFDIEHDPATGEVLIAADFRRPKSFTPQLAHSLIQAIQAGGRFTASSLLSLIEVSKFVLSKEPSLIDLCDRLLNTDDEDDLDDGGDVDDDDDDLDDGENDKKKDSSDDDPKSVTYTVVGDLHGSLHSLSSVLHVLGDAVAPTTNSPPNSSPSAKSENDRGGYGDENRRKQRRRRRPVVIFNGDFVDRGQESLEVLCILLLLKLAYPRRVYLLRGNHEDDLIASVYGFRDEIRAKYGSHSTSPNTTTPSDDPATETNTTTTSTTSVDDIWDAIVQFFPTLPLVARTSTAIILHGGIPHEQFDISQIAQITPQQRCRFTSAAIDIAADATGDSQHEDAVQKILWSDPDRTLVGDDASAAKQPNPRGLGIRFGPSVARRFLDVNDAQYLIRSHEPVKRGIEIMDCGEDRGNGSDHGHNDKKQVITVFSTAAYPGGQGVNPGAVLHLKETVSANPSTNDAASPIRGVVRSSHQPHVIGSYTIDTFPAPPRLDHRGRLIKRRTTPSRKYKSCYHTIRSLIVANRKKLEQRFHDIEDYRGYIPADQWRDIMATELDLTDLPWKTLQESLLDGVDTVENRSKIDWRGFIKEHASAADTHGVDGHQVQALKANQQMLRTVFKFLDEDGSGTVSLEEFRHAVDLLNKHLPQERQLKDAEHLFALVDTDKNGTIDIDEFGRMFSVL